MKHKLYGILIIVMLMTGCTTAEVIILNSKNVTEFEVKGKQLYMNELINSKTPKQLTKILSQHPELEEVVMLKVEGSVDDVANLKAARLVREHGLNTRLLNDSVVASGGTDFFLAGVERRIHKGAKLGVHSWSDGFKDGSQVSKDQPQHQGYLSYYREMGIPEEFYWYTLEAASANDIHWMTAEEIHKYAIVAD